MPAILPTLDRDNTCAASRVGPHYSAYNKAVDHPDPCRKFSKFPAGCATRPTTFALAPPDPSPLTPTAMRQTPRFRHTPLLRTTGPQQQQQQQQQPQQPSHGLRHGYPRAYASEGFTITTPLRATPSKPARKPLPAPATPAAPTPPRGYAGGIKPRRDINAQCRTEAPGPAEVSRAIRASSRYTHSGRVSVGGGGGREGRDVLRLSPASSPPGEGVRRSIGRPGRYRYTPRPTDQTLKGVFKEDPEANRRVRPVARPAPYGVDRS